MLIIWIVIIIFASQSKKKAMNITFESTALEELYTTGGTQDH